MSIIFYFILLLLSCMSLFVSNLALVINLNIISLTTMVVYLLLGAPDVAMTEAALGVGLSTVLVINYLMSQKVVNKENIIFKDIPFDIIYYLILTISIALGLAYLIDWNNLFLEDSILHNYYVNNTKIDIHIDSFIAAVLACYRGFDTLIETCVVLIAGIGMFYIMNIEIKEDNTNLVYQSNPLILQVVKILLMYMLIFALYIQLNGTISPGGGFQFGGIIASIFILITKFFKNIKICPILILRIGAFGVLLYFMVGFISLFFNLYFLDYSYLHSSDYVARHIGIELVELGVGIAVAAMLILIYLVSEYFNV